MNTDHRFKSGKKSLSLTCDLHVDCLAAVELSLRHMLLMLPAPFVDVVMLLPLGLLLLWWGESRYAERYPALWSVILPGWT